MFAPRVDQSPRGVALTEADHQKLASSWITPELAEQAMIRRVTSSEGAGLVGRKPNGEYAGLVLPYVWPGEAHIRAYRLRRDLPPIEYDAQGKWKEKDKYLSAPGQGNLLYTVPGMPAEWLADATIPVVVVEGEKKAIALFRLALYGTQDPSRPRFLPIGLSGVWGWRGTVGKITDQNGARRDERGPIPDLSRITWKGRIVYVVFDRNVYTNKHVANARHALTDELARQGAEVRWVNLPSRLDLHGGDVNGVDDLLALWGPDRVLKLFDEAQVPEKPEQTQAQLLVELAADAELFNTAEGEAYATFEVNGHRETWLIRGKGFRRWLVGRFYRKFRKPPGSQALQDAIGVLEAQAQYDAPTAMVFTRVAPHEDDVYVDLCNDSWESVRITAGGWTVVSEPPVRFRRAKGMMALPRPVNGGTWDLLRRLVNIGGDTNWVLCSSWLVAACRPAGPYPILIVEGEQGSCKSTLVKILRRLIDPSAALLRTPPREERDLVIAANNSWIVAFDNVSGIPDWLSDALCRLATGGGFSTRELYTDSDEVLFSSMRPVALNGIDHLAERPDLADRALILHLPAMDAEHRREEAELYAEFEKNLPQILGVLFNTVGMAIKYVTQTKLGYTPRMADFAVWATAAETGFGLSPGTFMRAYTGNRVDAVETTLDGDLVATAIILMMEKRQSAREEPWKGTCKELLEELEQYTDETARKARAWPKTPRAMSSRLKRLVTFFREVSIDVTLPEKGTGGNRILTISRRVTQNTAASATTAKGKENLQSNQPANAFSGNGATDDEIGRSPLDTVPPPGDHAAGLRDAGAASRNGHQGGEGGGAFRRHSSSVCGQEAMQCYVCQGMDFWRDQYGNQKCKRCYPPAPATAAATGNC